MLDYVSSESPHKNLHIRITVLFERIGDFIQSVCNLRFGFFDFYRFVLYFYHQISHMAELCHINIKRRLRRHIFFPNKVLQEVLCLADDTAEQIR